MRFIFAPPGADKAMATGYTWQPDARALHPLGQIYTVLATEIIT